MGQIRSGLQRSFGFAIIATAIILIVAFAQGDTSESGMATAWFTIVSWLFMAGVVMIVGIGIYHVIGYLGGGSKSGTANDED